MAGKITVVQMNTVGRAHQLKFIVQPVSACCPWRTWMDRRINAHLYLFGEHSCLRGEVQIQEEYGA